MLGEAATAALRPATALRTWAAGTCFLLLAVAQARADPPYFANEVWAGADASRNVWLAYTGATIAPYGGIFSDGVRLRAATGYGGYHYVGERRGVLQSFTAKTYFADALVGYLKRLGPLTAKAFVGISAIHHRTRPADPQNPVEGLQYGPKGVVELWLNMGSDAWSSLDLNWTSAHQTYAGRVRAGYRVLDRVSFGAEVRLDGNALDKDTRGGLFVRYDWTGGEISVAGGVAGRSLEDARDMTDPYATATWLMQY